MDDFKTTLVNRFFTYLPILLCGITSIILACRSGKIDICRGRKKETRTEAGEDEVLLNVSNEHNRGENNGK